MTTKKTKATSAPKKTVGQKIDKKIETIARIDDIVIEEVTEPVGTVTFKRWHVALVAAAITAAALVIIF